MHKRAVNTYTSVRYFSSLDQIHDHSDKALKILKVS